MTDSLTKLSPEEVQFVLSLVREARTHGIVEIAYRDLKLRLSPQAAQTGTGPVAVRNPDAWSTSLPSMQPSFEGQ